MNYEIAFNEIKRLKEQNEGKIEYENIYKILKEILAVTSSVTDNREILIYMLYQILEVWENRPKTNIEEDISYGQQSFRELEEMREKDDTVQKIVNVGMAEMYSILLFANVNQKVIFKYLNMLFTSKPLTPLTYDLKEWEAIGKYDEFNIYVNKRCDKVFMDERTKKVTYTEGKIFITENNEYIINEDSAVELKLPSLLPQTEYIKL